MNIGADRQLWSSHKQFSASKSFDFLLMQRETSVEAVLQSGEAVAAAKKAHPPLVKFLKGKKFSDLIEYVVDDPLPDLSLHDAASFPFLSTEILTDCCEILDLFFTSGAYLEQLFAFLDKEELNPTSAGYFSKVAQSLLCRNAPRLVEFLFLLNNYGARLLRHVESRPIAEFLGKLIQCEPGLPHFTYEKLLLIESLCAVLTPSCSQSALCNASQLLLDLTAARSLKGWRVYMSVLFQPRFAQQFARSLSPDHTHLCSVAAKLLTSLLNLQDFDAISKINYMEVEKAIRKQLGKPLNPLMEINIGENSPLPSILQSLFAAIPGVISLLETSCYPESRMELWKLDLFDLLSALLFLPQAVPFLIEHAVVPTAVDLFRTQVWNSLFHIAFERFVHRIVEGGDLRLRKELVIRCEFPVVLAEIAAEPFLESANKRKIRKGCMGYVTKLGKYMLESELLRSLLAMFECESRWVTFVSVFLSQQLRTEARKLGESSESDSESSETYKEPAETALPPTSDFSFQPYSYWRLPLFPASVALPDLD